MILPVIVTVLFSGICAFTDIMEYKIYNLITVPALLLGLIFNGLWGRGFLFALAGIGLGMITLIPGLLGGIGGGDIKMLAAMGAWLGFGSAATILFFSCLFGIMWFAGKYTKKLICREKTVSQVIPFGVCLFCGLLLLLGLEVVKWI